MKIEVNENRNITQSGIAGTQNENNVTELEIIVPEKYKDFVKKITFITEDGVIPHIIKGNTYLLTKATTKYRRVGYYITLTKGDEIFNSVPKELEFNDNTPADGEVTEEDLGLVHEVVTILEEEITKVTDLEKEVQALIEDIQFKLDNGELIGPQGPKGEPGAIKMQFLNNLPETGSDDTLYFIPAKEPTEENQYDEYAWINKGTEEQPSWVWEYLGSPKVQVNLEEYEKKEEHQADILNLQAQINNKVNKSAFVYDEDTETLTITI